jgi:hypothetical protein
MSEHKWFPFQKMPAEVLAKWYRPAVALCCIFLLSCKIWQFGTTSEATYFDLISALVGAFLFEVVSIVVFLMLHWNQMGSYLRFLILYFAFVPHLTITYLLKIFDPEYLFAMRDDTQGGKWAAAFAFWSTDLVDLMAVLLPFLILVLGAHMMVMDPKRMQDSTGYELKNLLKLPQWYFVAILLCIVMSFGIMFFAGMVNLLRYLISMLVVCVISDSWERIRRGSSLEPPLIVAWAELLLFLTLALKGIMEIIK